jgi:hypothetical protein
MLLCWDLQRTVLILRPCRAGPAPEPNRPQPTLPPRTRAAAPLTRTRRTRRRHAQTMRKSFAAMRKPCANHSPPCAALGERAAAHRATDNARRAGPDRPPPPGPNLNRTPSRDAVQDSDAAALPTGMRISESLAQPGCRVGHFQARRRSGAPSFKLPCSGADPPRRRRVARSRPGPPGPGGTP